MNGGGLPVFGYDFFFEELKRSEIEIAIERHHQKAGTLHDVNVNGRTRQIAEVDENDAVSGDQQKSDGDPNPKEKAWENLSPEFQAVGTIKNRDGRP